MSEKEQRSTPNNPNPSETSENGYSQTEIIELLQKTIGQLDRIVNQLNTESVEMPSKIAVETVVTSIEALAASLTETEKVTPVTPVPTETFPTATEIVPTSVASDAIAPEKEKVEELSEDKSGIDRILPSFSRLQSWWDGVLDKIRSLLPASLQTKLSDWVLTGILAGIVVTVLLTSVLLLPGQPTTEIVQSPPSETTPEIAPPTTSTAPKVVQTPTELEAPGSPQPVEMLPPPKPELSPEQSLIAAIQDQVTGITTQYPEGLVLSVEANFLGSRLMVKMGDDWYKLNPSRQDKLVNSILERSRKLDFRKLEIVNSQGTLLARNPVVGNKMIILKREV